AALHRARAGPPETSSDRPRSRVSFQRGSTTMKTLLLFAVLAQAQPAGTLSGVVKDATGLPMQGAIVTTTAGTSRETARTGADGAWSVPLPARTETVTVNVEASGFAAERLTVRLPSGPLSIELRPESISEQVTVSAESA